MSGLPFGISRVGDESDLSEGHRAQGHPTSVDRLGTRLTRSKMALFKLNNDSSPTGLL